MAECCAPNSPEKKEGVSPSHHHNPSTRDNSLVKIVCAFVLSTISMISGMPEWIGADRSMGMVSASAIASILLVALFGRHFLIGIKDLFRSANMNTLVGIGILASWGLSFWNLWQGRLDQIYFEAAAFVASFVLLGQWIESWVHRKMHAELTSLQEFLPHKAHRLDGEKEELVSSRSLRVGDRIRILVGERVPVDARILSQAGSSFDESLMTGESKPVMHEKDEIVVQGSVNIGQPVEAIVLRVSADSVYEVLVRDVQKTLKERPPLQKKVDRFATFFVPAVILLSVGVAVFWYFFRPGTDLYVVTSVSVLVIACPCAIGMATPAAFLVGVLRAGRRGLLIKSLGAVEKASDINLIAFDKTGTLTTGRPEVERMKAIENYSHRELLQLALSVEVDSEHPYADAMKRRAKAEQIPVLPSSNRVIEPGKGVKGIVEKNGKKESVVAGNLLWLYENGIERITISQDLIWDADGSEATVLWVASEGKVLGILFLADQLRPSAREVVSSLHQDGYEVGMITGDAENVARSIAKQLQLKFFHAGVLPSEKATIVKRLSAPKKKGLDFVQKKVAFVGDGVNDAPALAEAHLGVAMGQGAAISQSAAEAIVVSNDLRAVPELFEILSKTRRLIYQNLSLSFGYNVLAIPLAAGALYPLWGILLNPMVASAAMALSSVTVLFNSLRALRN